MFVFDYQHAEWRGLFRRGTEVGDFPASLDQSLTTPTEMGKARQRRLEAPPVQTWRCRLLM